MTTDDERREVARRLRGYVDMPDGWWQETLPHFYIEKCVFGDLTRHGEDELFARLADLTEPSCDRDALLALADDLEADADRVIKAAKNARFGGGPRMGEAKHEASEWRSIARRIREACGAKQDD